MHWHTNGQIKCQPHTPLLYPWCCKRKKAQDGTRAGRPHRAGSKRPSFYSANKKKKGILSFGKLRQTPIHKTNKSRPADHNLLGFRCAAHEYLLRFNTMSRLTVKNKRLSISLRLVRCNKNQENLRSRKWEWGKTGNLAPRLAANLTTSVSHYPSVHSFSLRFLLWLSFDLDEGLRTNCRPLWTREVRNWILIIWGRLQFYIRSNSEAGEQIWKAAAMASP